jgi:hypothetical protein
MHTFMTTRKLAGAEFSGPTWATWRMIARLIDGDAHLLTAEDRALALRLTGRTVLPTVAPREVYVGAGRRGGKSRFGALVATWLAAAEYPQLSAGETAIVVHIAPDKRQAEIDLDYARGIVNDSKLLRAELIGDTADGLEFAHRVRLETATASYRTVRGRTLAGAVVDESAFLRADDSALPDKELVRALRPGLLTLRGPLLVISSPHRKLGILYDAHRKYFGNDAATRGLYIQASSRELNPGIDEQDVAEAMEDDPAAAQSEYLGHFREDLQGFLDDATIDAAIVPGRRMLPRNLACKHVAFADPSGGRGDSFTLAIAHAEPAKDAKQAGRAVLDVLQAVPPPFDPETVVSSYAETLKNYGLREVTGDQYAGEWVPAAFQRYGITYTPSELTRSEIYLECLPLFSQGRVELLDLPVLRTQLLLLERRTRAGGRDSVDHPRGAHDDHANAAAGALRLAAPAKVGKSFFDMDDAALRAISHGLAAGSSRGRGGGGFSL